MPVKANVLGTKSFRPQVDTMPGSTETLHKWNMCLPVKFTRTLLQGGTSPKVSGHISRPHTRDTIR